MSTTNGLKQYNRGSEILYVLGDNLYTEHELDVMDAERQKKDEQAGYEARKAHYYDKWYRYTRSDNGAAYDRGVAKCVNEAESYSAKWHKDDESDFHIIEIAKCNQ